MESLDSKLGDCFCFVIDGRGNEFSSLIVCPICSQGLSYLIDPDLGCCIVVGMKITINLGGVCLYSPHMITYES